MYNHSSLYILRSSTTTRHTATDMSPINRSRSRKRAGQICRVTELMSGVSMSWMLGGDWVGVSALSQCVSTEPVCQHSIITHAVSNWEEGAVEDFQGSTTRWCNFWHYCVLHNNFIQYVGLITTLNIQVSALPTSGSIPWGLYYYGHKWEAVLVSLQMHKNANVSSEGWFINKYVSCR